MRDTLLTAAILTQKYSKDPKALLDWIHPIFGNLSPVETRNLLQPVVVHYFEIVNIRDEKRVILEVDQNVKGTFVVKRKR